MHLSSYQETNQCKHKNNVNNVLYQWTGEDGFSLSQAWKPLIWPERTETVSHQGINPCGPEGLMSSLLICPILSIFPTTLMPACSLSTGPGQCLTQSVLIGQFLQTSLPATLYTPPYFHIQPWRWRHYIFLKHWYLFTSSPSSVGLNVGYNRLNMWLELEDK